MRTQVKWMLFALLATACTVQQQNGQDIRLEQPFILSDQHWHISKQQATQDGDRICTVSSGELDITQRAHNHAIVQQVGTSELLEPGDRYKVLIGAHVYESPQTWFDAAQSQAIIRDIASASLIYTETRKTTLVNHHEGPVWRSISNKIPVDDFSRQYQACANFVKSHSK